MSNEISFILNGERVVSKGKPGDRLLDILRDEFNLTGTKCGCKEGECGACSVLIDGKLANSCMVALGSIVDSEVVTIEGYSKTKRFQVLSDAYAEFSAVQCGFCIPGMVLASEALLSKNPHPSESEIREGISGNLCRCTGYNAIVHAIKSASEKGAGLW
jgi:carbon-monoxide dehydrogenase small subunit